MIRMYMYIYIYHVYMYIYRSRVYVYYIYILCVLTNDLILVKTWRPLRNAAGHVFLGLEADKQHTIENWVLFSWGIIRLTTILLRGSVLTGRKIHLIQTHSIMTFVGIQRKCEHQWLHDWHPYSTSCVRTFQGGNIIYSCGSKPDSSKTWETHTGVWEVGHHDPVRAQAL